jgi:hypothetical protein
MIKDIPHPNHLPKGEGIATYFKDVNKISNFRDLILLLNSSL